MRRQGLIALIVWGWYRAVMAWKSVVGFAGYEVSDRGEVRSARDFRGGVGKAKRALRPSLAGTISRQYLSVMLRAAERSFRRYLHRLVLEAFVGLRPEGQEARHLNGDRLDNRLVNLVWGTKLENAADKERHGTHVRGEPHRNAKLTEHDVRSIRELVAAGVSKREAARRFGVSEMAVHAVVNRRTWAHVA